MFSYSCIANEHRSTIKQWMNSEPLNLTTNTNSSNQGSQSQQDRTPWLKTALSPERPCIRILRLQKGAAKQPIQCTLAVAYLDEKPSYEVLSYVWGDANDTRPIHVDGSVFKVTKNLIDFLQCLRRPDEDRFIWADAICIDQSNEEEKSHQITLMTTIYREAAEAHIWLGPFDNDNWQREMMGAKGYILADEMDPKMWKQYEEIFKQDLQYFARQEGFNPLPQKEYEAFEARFGNDMFGETLKVLDFMAKGDHLYTYPVYTVSDEPGPSGRPKYGMIRTWPWLMDVIRWIMLRTWWTRVWTLQEVVLPRVDPIVHAPPHSFRLSRLLNGVTAMLRHNGKACCKWYGRIVLAQYRDRDEGAQYTQVIAASAQRRKVAEACKQGHEDIGVPLYLVIDAIKGRNATEIRDNWWGIFGLLPTQWQEQSKQFPVPSSTAGLFNQCSKLLYLQAQELTELILARRTKQSKIDSLPTWTIDLSESQQGTETELDHWQLYNATPGTKYEGLTEWPELKTNELFVKARYICSIQAVGMCVPDIKPGPEYRKQVHKTVKEWYKLYSETVATSNNDSFWRTIFMDRNVQIHWMHERNRPLGQPRLTDIKHWWSAWTRTGDYHDLTLDRKSGGVFHGTYHFRALEVAIEKATFFVTGAGEPGMGPHDARPGDVVYALSGCRALAVLRKVSVDGFDSFNFVGLSFVDGWMHGRAVHNGPNWETLLLS